MTVVTTLILIFYFRQLYTWQLRLTGKGSDRKLLVFTLN